MGLTDLVSSSWRQVKHGLKTLGVAAAITVAASPALAGVRDHYIDVGAFDNGVPEVGAQVYVINQAEADTLKMQTGENGRAVWDPTVSAVEDDIPSVLNSLGNVFPNPLGPHGNVTYRVEADKLGRSDQLAVVGVDGAIEAYLHPGMNNLDRALGSGAHFIWDRNTGDVSKFMSMGQTRRIDVKQEVVDKLEAEVSSYDGSKARTESLPVCIEVNNGTRTIVDDSAVLEPYPVQNVFSYDFDEGGAIDRVLSGDAWNLLDDPLYGGMLYLRNASGQVFSAPVDSSFALEYSINNPSEELKMWLEHPDMSPSGVMFARDGLAVRHRVAQAAAFVEPDTMTTTADNPNLSGPVRYKGVDQMWIDDELWLGLRNRYHRTRGEDREEEDGAWRLEGFTHEYDSSEGEFGDLVIPSVLEDIEFLINYKKDLLTGGQPDGTVYGNVSAELVDEPQGGFGVAYLFVDNTAPPGNWPYTVGGYTEAFFSRFPYGANLNTKAEEFYGEELTDVNGDLQDAIDNGYLNDTGRAAFNAHYLFDDGVDFVPNYKMAPAPEKEIPANYKSIATRILDDIN